MSSFSQEADRLIKPINTIADQSGYRLIRKIRTTTQGNVYTAMNKMNEKIVIKTINNDLASNKQGMIKMMRFNTKKNTTKEGRILKHLWTQNPPNSLIEYINDFNYNNSYYLITKYGGISLKDHISSLHNAIECKQLSLKKFKKHIKYLFKEMLYFINWLHNICGIAHMNISLDNILINGFEMKNGNIIKNGNIKFIDFSYSEIIDNKKWTNYIGNYNYMAPELINKNEFNTKNIDLWNLGVTLFIMWFGVYPYRNKKTGKCEIYHYLMKNKLRNWCDNVEKMDLYSLNLQNILKRLICQSNKRQDCQKLLNNFCIKMFLN